MKIYAFKNRRNGKYITGTDFRCYPYRQIMSDFRTPLLVTESDLEYQIKHRGINKKTYKSVEVKICEVK